MKFNDLTDLRATTGMKLMPVAIDTYAAYLVGVGLNGKDKVTFLGVFCLDESEQDKLNGPKHPMGVDEQ